MFVFLAALLLCLGLTNQLHKWAHAADAPTAVRWLQAMRLVLPRQGHALHHASHRDHFCITTGWNNGWLSRTRLLQRLFGQQAGALQQSPRQARGHMRLINVQGKQPAIALTQPLNDAQAQTISVR